MKVVQLSKGFNYTYDFNVNKTHNYFSNGFISHNSKLVFREIKRIFDRAPLIQMMAEKVPVEQNDNCNFHICGSSITALPLGSGDKIRGERGHVIVVDEIDAINKEVFDIVIRGFGATQSEPWDKTKNILLQFKKSRQKSEKFKSHNEASLALLEAGFAGNKVIVAGTAGHNTGHFYKLYSQYNKIISYKIKGNLKDYSDIIGADDIEDNVQVDYKQYCIVRYPYTDLPVGLMDVQMIHNARSTMSKTYFAMEYEAKFADDSDGFFKWKDIQAATVQPPGWNPTLHARPGYQYVFGIDPARSRDRYAVVVIELGKPKKVAYVWSSKKQRWQVFFKRTRQLVRLFQPIGIGLDKFGGGSTIEDLFVDSAYMESGDHPIVPFDADEKKMTIPPGSHKILFPINFGPSWIEEANILLQKDIENKELMFPCENLTSSVKNNSWFRAMDEAIDEINKMKKELASIEVTYNQGGSKRFNLKPPDIKSEPGEIVTHKDRYSALLLANYVASRFQQMSFDPQEEARQAYTNTEPGGWLEEFGFED